MPPAERAAMLKQYREMAETLTKQLAKDDTSIALYSRRGDCHMFLAEFEASRRDYEKMIELDPDLFAQHWRLGIAYYYTGEFEKSAKQFDAYDTYNDRDRENGVWQFMARVKVSGIDEARKKMLQYDLFDREPFPQLYAMFEGKDPSGGDDLLKEIRTAEISESERARRLFFANLYVGIFKEMTGDTAGALARLHDAAASKWGQAASGGPTYMWQVARLHYEQLLAKQKPEHPAPKPEEE
jgi:lipoprotein NlpI